MTVGELVRLGILIYTLSVLTVFVIAYRKRPWRDTEPGRWLMRTKVSAVALLASALVGALFPYDLDITVRTAGLAVYGITSTGLLLALIRTPND